MVHQNRCQVISLGGLAPPQAVMDDTLPKHCDVHASPLAFTFLPKLHSAPSG
jgi:hypothetical protein